MKRFLRIVLSLFTVFLLLFLINIFISYKPLSHNKLNERILTYSFEKGRSFLLNNQKDAGNFTYQYNFVDKSFDSTISQVRQAGALWGLALVHQHEPSETTRKAIIKGIEFFKSYTKALDSTKSYIVYPGSGYGSTGTMAIVSLALVDFLCVEKDLLQYNEYKNLLNSYLNFLTYLRNDAYLFDRIYSFEGEKYGGNSSYFDGESLLALVKAAKYMGFTDLKEMIQESAEAMYQEYVINALNRDPDSDETKGFYQWGSMSFYEIYTAGWNDVYGDRVIDMAYWMIDVHKTLKRSKNTAYAYEGMIHAWEIARMNKKTEAEKKIGRVIDKGLFKLTTWQVEGPRENLFLRTRKTKDELAVGGIMNFCCDHNLRIDVTQHQMHAVILALKYIYADQDKP